MILSYFHPSFILTTYLPQANFNFFYPPIPFLVFQMVIFQEVSPQKFHMHSLAPSASPQAHSIVATYISHSDDSNWPVWNTVSDHVKT